MKISYSTPLFSGLQIARFDLFCLEMIRSDRATITISLHSDDRSNLNRVPLRLGYPRADKDAFHTQNPIDECNRDISTVWCYSLAVTMTAATRTV